MSFHFQNAAFSRTFSQVLSFLRSSLTIVLSICRDTSQNPQKYLFIEICRNVAKSCTTFPELSELQIFQIIHFQRRFEKTRCSLSKTNISFASLREPPGKRPRPLPRLGLGPLGPARLLRLGLRALRPAFRGAGRGLGGVN